MASYCLHTCHSCGRLFQADHVRLIPAIGSRIFHRRLPLSPSPPHLELTTDEVPHFPAGAFSGRLLLISRPSLETNHLSAIHELMDSPVLGCDTETRPQNGSRPCLVQLASRDLCVMWRLRRREMRREGFPPMLRAILRSPEITKVRSVL